MFCTHTLYGFLGNSSYGGNRDNVGWKLIGFEDRMAYQPPFGYYDGGGQDGKRWAVRRFGLPTWWISW
jgi:hypothetical protein